MQGKVNKDLSTTEILVVDDAFNHEHIGSLYHKGKTLLKAGKFKRTNPDLERDVYYMRQNLAKVSPQIKFINEKFNLMIDLYFNRFNSYTKHDLNDDTIFSLLHKSRSSLCFPRINYVHYPAVDPAAKDKELKLHWHCDEPRIGASAFHIKHPTRRKDTIFPMLYSMILYLTNNPDTTTDFAYFDKQIEAKAGRFLMFPSRFPYLHRANRPRKDGKLIIVAPLHIDITGEFYTKFNNLDSNLVPTVHMNVKTKEGY